VLPEYEDAMKALGDLEDFLLETGDLEEASETDDVKAKATPALKTVAEDSDATPTNCGSRKGWRGAGLGEGACVEALASRTHFLLLRLLLSLWT
jgi:hypothetical protein